MANMELITSVTVGSGGAASVTLPATGTIPATYTDLQVFVSSRGNSSGVAEANRIHFNGDTTNTNYTAKRLLGSGSAASSDQTATIVPGFFNNRTSSTASTFSNSIVYIPNYRSSNSKSYSIDTVTENNATEAYMALLAVNWSGTAAITTMTFTPESSALFVEGSTFYLYGISNVTSGSKATGGIVSSDGTYWYHMFPFSGTFTPTTNLSADYLVIAGGGSGGGATANDDSGEGGGGAGGLRSTVAATGGGGALESALSLTANTNYTITIGAGGATSSTTGNSGSNSVFSTITATGGGGGGGQADSNGQSGGSGGGSRGGNPAGSAGTRTASPVQGFNGGVGVSGTTNYNGGGGGGAGAVGANGATNGGDGGIGVAISAFANVTQTGANNGYYAGGGGGGTYSSGGSAGGAGGLGGGGSGGKESNGTAGTVNTGSGGGGAANRAITGKTGGNGGSGLVIIRYAI